MVRRNEEHAFRNNIMRGRVLLLITLLLLVVATDFIPLVTGVSRINWAKSYGGGSIASIDQTFDGGFVLAGNVGLAAWVLRLDANGDVIWQKTYSGLGFAGASAVRQVLDRGFIVAGATFPSVGHLTQTWVLRLDGEGNKVWENAYHSGQVELSIEGATSVEQTLDEGFIIVGFPGVLRLDKDGNVLWQKDYSGLAHEGHQTSDGGFIVAGDTIFGTGRIDAWVIRLDADGNPVWEHAYGGPEINVARSIHQTSDGGFVIAGETNSFGAGKNDIWVLQLDSVGMPLWQRAYGGPEDDIAWSVLQTFDQGFVVVGGTNSFGAGKEDIWILRLNSEGSPRWQRTYGGPESEGAFSAHQTFDKGFILGGTSDSFGPGIQSWVLRANPGGIIPACRLTAPTSAVVTDTTAVVSSLTSTGVDFNTILTTSSSAVGTGATTTLVQCPPTT